MRLLEICLALNGTVFLLSFARGYAEEGKHPAATQTLENVSLAGLLTKSDLIMLGSPANPRTTGGDLHVTEIAVVRIIASTWSVEDTLRHLHHDKDGGRRVFCVQHAQASFASPRVALSAGGEFLLFLKQAELKGEDATQVAVTPAFCFRVVGAQKGAILLSDPKKLEGYAAMQRHAQQLRERLKQQGAPDATIPDHPYTLQDDYLKRNFGTADRSALIAATEDFAWVLSHETYGRTVLERLAQGEQVIYSSTARDLLRLPKLKKFHCLGL